MTRKRTTNVKVTKTVTEAAQDVGDNAPVDGDRKPT